MLTVGVGEAAPDFELPSHDGGLVRLSGLRGRVVVLFFYPRAFTSGCTREAKRFNELYEEFASLGAVVLGVSTDSVERNRRFAEKLGLRYRLLSDVEGRVAGAYGVLRRSRSGRLSAERVTFVIGLDGVVRAVLRGLRPAERHAEEALRVVRGLVVG